MLMLAFIQAPQIYSLIELLAWLGTEVLFIVAVGFGLTKH